MSNGPEESDREVIALLEKLAPAPQRNPQAAASGKSKFLAEGREYAAEESVRREQRHIGWKENAMRLSRISFALLMVVVVGLVVVYASSRTLPASRSFGAPPSVSNVEIFVAGQNIPQGATITEDQLATISLPQDKVSAVEFSADRKNQLVGRIAKFPLDQGTVITSSMLGDMAQPAMAAPQWPAISPGQHMGVTKTPISIVNPQPTPNAGIPIPPGVGYPGQMIIKNANIRLMVKDTDAALDGVTRVVGDVRGYILGSQVSNQEYQGTNYKRAMLTIGVPVDQFENAMRRLRGLGVQVLDENASGQDVTSQYVDLQSQLTNLEATRDRIRTFLDQATNVDEALRVNQQLSEVEAQIEQIKGQMNYLSNRSAFSTITINLEPQLPKVTKTPSPKATPTPVAGSGKWDAGKTAQQATHTLASAYQWIADFLIWFFVVILPVFGPPVVLVWLAVWFLRRRNRAATKEQGAQD